MSESRADRASALEAWADSVEPDDLVLAETSTLRAIVELVELVELVEQRDHVDGVVSLVR